MKRCYEWNCPFCDEGLFDEESYKNHYCPKRMSITRRKKQENHHVD